MFEHKLIQIISLFDRKEMTRFKEFAFSPYFNKHNGVRKLIQYLSDQYPRFSPQNCDRYELFTVIFEAEKHDQAKLALIFTYAQRLLERFLIEEQVQADTFQRNLAFLKILRKKGIYKLYEKKLKKFERQAFGASLKDSQYYHRLYLLASEADYYYTIREKHQKDHSIQRKQEHLDRFFLAEKLKDACEMKVRSKILKINYDTSLVEAVYKEVEQNLSQYTDIPAILIYFRIYQMVYNEDVDAFYAIHQELSDLLDGFSHEESQSIYNYLLHFCVERINQGNLQFLNELFLIYQKQLEKGLLFEEGYLSEWHYKNIVTTGLRLNETDWVGKFIEKYKCKLAPEATENAYTYNKAAYYYEIGEYEKVMKLLQRVEYSDIRYSLGAKALLLRTYYDLDVFDSFLSLAESFKQYLHRNKTISDYRRKGFSNLIRFARRAFQIKTDLGFISTEKLFKELKRLKKDVDKAETIFNQSWLDAKIKEMEKELAISNEE